MNAVHGDNGIYLCLDQGGHSSRVLAFSPDGQLLARAQETVQEHRLKPLWVEQDPTELVTSLQRCLERITCDPALRGRRFVAAGLATQRASICCWNRRTGEALTPVISWQDRRGHAWLDRFQDHSRLIQQRTGLTLSAHYGVSKLRWCLDHVGAVRAALNHNELCCGPLASYLLFALLDEKPFQVDPANASRTLLWNIRETTWDPDLLALFQIPPQTLPVLTETRARFGNLSLDSDKIPLRICTGDQSAALYAHGVPHAHCAYVNMGTGAFVSTPCANVPEDTAGLLCSLVFKSGNDRHYVLEGTVNGAGSALDHEANQAQLPIETVNAALNTWLQTQTSPPLFLNGISGLGAPFWVADFPSRYIGSGDATAKMTAVAESIVFLIVTILQHMARLTPVETLQISGGLSRHDELCQRLADLSGCRAIRAPESEATAQGVAWLLAEKPSRWQTTTPQTVFAPRENKSLNARFDLWYAELLKALGENSV